MPRKSPSELLRARALKWKDEDPSSLATRQVEKATSTLQWLVEMLLPNVLVKETVEKTLWAAEVMTDRTDVLKKLNIDDFSRVKDVKLEHCDAMANEVHNWSMGTAAALGAWDFVGPIGVAPALASLFALSFRTIKKIGLAYGYDTSTPQEELIVLEIFNTGASLYHRDKIRALTSIAELDAQGTSSESAVRASVEKMAEVLTANMVRRRSLASVPVMGALVGGSTNAWFLKDIGWAARNLYVMRRLAKEDAAKAAAKKQSAVVKQLPTAQPVSADEVIPPKKIAA